MNNFFCRVCGYKHIELQWGIDGKSPIYDFCPCCGVESGNEDYSIESTRAYRKKWIDTEAKWYNKRLKPDDWDLTTQLKNIPIEFI